MVIVSVAVFFMMPYLAKWFFGGIGDQAAIDELVMLSRLLLLQPICLGISNVLGVITQIGKRFFIYALSPIFYNLCIIFGMIVLFPMWGIRGVVAGVIFGGVMHFLVQLPYVSREKLVPAFTLAIDFKAIKNIIKISIPRTIALSAHTFELIALTAMASFLVTGSIAVFNLAFNLQSVPLAIVGVSYALAAFPTLSACFAKGEREQFMNHIVTAVRHVIFWSIPIAGLFIVLRAQIVRTVLGSGNFNWENTRLTAACVALFTLSLVAQAVELLFIRAYYAAGKTKKPLVVSLISALITIALPFLLLKLFQNVETFRYFAESLLKIEGIPGGDVIMLPLGYSLGALLGACAFWIIFEKDFKYGNFSKRTLPTLFVSIQAAIFGSFVAYIGLNIFDNAFNLETLSGIFLQGLCAGTMGIIATAGVFILLGNEEIKVVWATLRQRVIKNKIIVSEPDQLEV